MGDGGAQDLDRSLALARGALRNHARGGSVALSSRSDFGCCARQQSSLGPQPAFAYRPFDSTDPAVADPGELEIEFSPVSFRRDDSGDTWIAPQLKLNYGIAPNWEFVIEGQGEHPQFEGAAQRHGRQRRLPQTRRARGHAPGADGSKHRHRIRRALARDQRRAGLGAEVAGIIGNQWSWGAIYFTAAAALDRDNRGEMFLGTIIEGPARLGRPSRGGARLRTRIRTRPRFSPRSRA